MPDLNLNNMRTAVLSLGLFQGVPAHTAMAGKRDTIGKAKGVLAAARAADITVIHVVIGFREGYPEVSSRNKLFSQFKENSIFRIGSEQVEIHEDVRPAPGEVVISRPRVNPFYNSELESILRAKEIDTLVLMGVPTNIIVESTARWAADADYRVIILEDCCASFSVEAHDWTLTRILPMLVDVASSADFRNSIR